MPKLRRKHKYPVRLTWANAQLLSRRFFRWLWGLLCALNPRRLLPAVSSLHLRSSFSVDPDDGSIVYQPSVWERISQSFAGKANKRDLLDWVQARIPHLRVVNLSSSWSDGVALCALVEALHPGACPRYDLLKPNNRENNCRLGLKLAFKYLGVPQNIVTPNEIAATNGQRESKIVQLLSLMKWASAQKHHMTFGSIGDQMTSVSKEAQRPCIARGSGLIVGLVNKRSKFDLHTPPNELLDISIKITGPKGENCDEKILSLIPDQSEESAEQENTVISQLQDGRSKFLTPANGKQIICSRHSSGSSDKMNDALKVPFDYKCVGEGSILVSYVPRNEGIYMVDVKWKNSPVKGSPFKVTVADTIENLNKCKKGHMRQSSVTLQHRPTEVAEEVPELSHQEDEEEDMPTGTTAAVLSRSSKVQRSMTPNGKLLQSTLAKHSTITRRRVLRRVITSGGQEIVIQMAPPTPTNSQDSGDRLPTSLESPTAGRKRKPKRKGNDRSFDFEIWYDSDTSHTSSNNSRCVTPHEKSDISLTSNNLYSYAHEVIEAVIQDVFRIAESNQRLRHLTAKNLHPQSSDASLSIPCFDVKFQCSPFSKQEEKLKRKSESEESDIRMPLCGGAETDPLVKQGLALLRDRLHSSSSIDCQDALLLQNKESHADGISLDNPVKNLLHAYQHLMSDTESSMTSALETDSDSQTKKLAAKKVQKKQRKLNSNERSPSREKNKRKEIYQNQLTPKSEKEEAIILRYKSESKEALIDLETPMTTPDSMDDAKAHLTSCTEADDFSYPLEAHMAGHSTTDAPYHNLRISRSLPTLYKKWKAFDLDDEVDVNQGEIESISIAAQQQRPKRTTIGPCDMNELLHEFNSQNKEPETNREMINKCKTLKKETKAESSGFQLLDANSPRYLSPRVSPMSTPSTSQTNSCRPSPPQGLSQHSESLSVWRPITSMSPLSPSSALNHIYPTNRSEIKIPKVKTDRITQVSHEEIKRETSWKKPAQYVRPRPQMVRANHINLSSTSSEGSGKQTTEQPKRLTDVPKIVCGLDESTLKLKNGGNKEIASISNSPKFKSIEQPRQQVKDGSDIAHDPAPRKTPNRPKYISGHRAVCRKYFQGTIALDPKLISATTPTSPPSPSRIVNSWSFIRKLKVKEDEGLQCRRAMYRSGGCYKRRVSFSKRVMLHKRSSSSRSSQRNSNSKESSQIDKESESTPSSADMKNLKLTAHLHNHSISSPRESDIKGFQFKPLRVEQPSRASSGIVSDMTLTPTESEDKKKPNSVESLDGFGVTDTSRKLLLDELASFCQIGSHPNNSSPAIPSVMHHQESHTNLSSQSISANTEHDVTGSDSSDEVARLTSQASTSAWLQSTADQSETEKKTKGVQDSSYNSLKDFDLDELFDGDASSEGLNYDGSSTDFALPDPFRCRAIGSGLSHGTVHARNNFQVLARTFGNGNLTVSITGQRPRTVKETQVVYTGDDLYEVLFEVSEPGQYVISIKWSDCSIPESPFICSVSY